MTGTTATAGLTRHASHSSSHGSHSGGGSGGHGPLARSNTRQQLRLGVSTDYTDLSLHSACANGNIGLVQYALTHGQPVNSVLNGVLPLHAAASSGNETIVRMLIEQGADVNAPRLPRRYSNDRSKATGIAAGTAGSTALHFAAANGHTAIIALLLSFGAHPLATDKHGLTPEVIATQSGFHQAAEILRNAAARSQGEDASSSGGHSRLGSSQHRKSITKKRIHPQRSFDALAVRLHQHASQPHLAGGGLASSSSTSLNTIHSIAHSATAGVQRRLSVPARVKDEHSQRRPSLPSVFERASHPSAALKHALGMTPANGAASGSDGKRRGSDSSSNAGAASIHGGSSSRVSLASTLFGRSRSNSAVGAASAEQLLDDDEDDLFQDEDAVDLGEDTGLVQAGVNREPTRTNSFSKVSHSTAVQSAPPTKTTFYPSDVARPNMTAVAGTSTVNSSKPSYTFYRPRQSSQLSGRPSISLAGPSPRVFADDDEEGQQQQQHPAGQDREPMSAAPDVQQLNFGRLQVSGPARTTGVDNLKRVETRTSRSNSASTDARFSSSAASSYSGPGALSTYAPTVSTAATSVAGYANSGAHGSASHKSREQTSPVIRQGPRQDARTSLSPLYENGHHSVSLATTPSPSNIVTSEQARSRVRKAEQALLSLSKSGLVSSESQTPTTSTRGGSGRGPSGHTALQQRLAAYGQSLSLERKLAAMEGAQVNGQSSTSAQGQYHIETIGSSSAARDSNIVSPNPATVTSQPLDTVNASVAKPATTTMTSATNVQVPQWRAIPVSDRLGPPPTHSGNRRSVSPNAGSVRSGHGQTKRIGAVQSPSPPRAASPTATLHAQQPHILGENPDAPKGPISYVEVVPRESSSTGGHHHHSHHDSSHGGSKGKDAATTPGGNGSRRSAGSHSAKGGGGAGSVTSAKEQVELDAIEQARIAQAVPTAVITATKKKSGSQGQGASGGALRRFFGASR